MGTSIAKILNYEEEKAKRVPFEVDLATSLGNNLPSVFVVLYQGEIDSIWTERHLAFARCKSAPGRIYKKVELNKVLIWEV